MQILSKEQLRFADEYTIQNEPISSIDLMDRAARACVLKISKLYDDTKKVIVFCGKGNNGGDGLAIGRLLLERGYQCKIAVVNYTENLSEDAKVNYDKLKVTNPDSVIEINNESDLNNTNVTHDSIVIDALLGTGLNKATEGLLAKTIEHLNANCKNIISIDCPSGLYIDKSNDPDDMIIRSKLTLTFQFPKLSFLFAQNKQYVPYFEVLNIGIHPNVSNLIPCDKFFVTKRTIKQILTVRPKFAHKGNFGHALIIAGSKQMRGAAIISAKACLRSGAGLLTVHSTASVIDDLMVSLPEAMSSIDSGKDHITELIALEKFDVVAIGPGIGTHSDTSAIIKKLFNYNKAALVLDADALNILSDNKTWLAFLPPESILTPHPKEFDRLTEKHENDFDRFKTAQQFAINNRCILILKGSYTITCMPDGSSYFNGSGNSGLAKGGSGDALTGIITGLIARGYTAPKAALIGVFIHGYAADLCVKKSSMESLLVSDVINTLGKAFKKLED